MAGDVRRSGSQWRAMGGAPAGGSAPPGAAHLPRTARECSRWRSAVTNGHSGTSACAPDAGTARTAGGRRAAHDVAAGSVSDIPDVTTQEFRCANFAKI
jgi:hypothetical protein